MHAQDADADVDGVDVGVGEPLSDGAAAVAGAVGVRLPVHAGVGEQPADLREVLAVGLAPGAVFLEHQPPAEPGRAVRQIGLREHRIERRRAVGHQHAATRAARAAASGRCRPAPAPRSPPPAACGTTPSSRRSSTSSLPRCSRRRRSRSAPGSAPRGSRGTRRSRSTGRRGRRRRPAGDRGRRRPAPAPERSAGRPTGNRRRSGCTCPSAPCIAASRVSARIGSSSSVWMTSRLRRSRKSRSTCGARSAISSTGSAGSWPMSTFTVVPSVLVTRPISASGRFTHW